MKLKLNATPVQFLRIVRNFQGNVYLNTDVFGNISPHIKSSPSEYLTGFTKNAPDNDCAVDGAL